VLAELLLELVDVLEPVVVAVEESSEVATLVEAPVVEVAEVEPPSA
jgi:hypothetical protein